MSMFQDYRYFEKTGSTNDDCARFLKEGAPHGLVVVADSQTAGKGRRGRNWDSPPGESVYMSIGLKPRISADCTSMLTLVAALAVCRATDDIAESDMSYIKWPNDIVVGGRKVCGILTELHFDEQGKPLVVIGIGINVNNRHFPQEITQTATSLYLELGHESDAKLLTEKVLEYFETYYEKFVEKCDMSTIMGEYVEKMINKDREVRVLDPTGEYTGTARGIDKKGQLLVEKKDGTVAAVYAGEVSVRGIYGYV